MRSTESVSIHTLHVLEEESLKRRFSELRMTVPPATALYVLNHKRNDLYKIEKAYDVKIFLEADDSLLFPTDFRMERVVRVEAEPVESSEQEDSETVAEDQPDEQPVVQERPQRERRRRRRRNRGEQNRENQEHNTDETFEYREDQSDFASDEVIQADAVFEEGLRANQKSEEPSEEHRDEKSGENPKRRRGHFLRRGRRFHSNRRHGEGEQENNSTENGQQDPILLPAPEPQKALPAPDSESHEEKSVKKPRRRYSNRRRKVPTPETAAE